MQIKNNVFVVTGGASGLGEGTARLLAQHGGKVVIADMQDEKGHGIAAEIGGQFMHCDVTQEDQAQAVIAKAQSMGKLSGLVNCAGIATAERTVGKSGPHVLAGFQRTIQINLLGSFNMIRLAAQAMSTNAPEDTGERGVLMGCLAGVMEAQYDTLRAGGHTPSEAFNETVEELTQSLIRLVDEKGMDWMFANCSSTQPPLSFK